MNRNTSSASIDPNDFFKPNHFWPAEALSIYDQFNKETKDGKWARYVTDAHVNQVDDSMAFVTSTGGKMFTGAVFCNKEGKKSKAVMTFHSWTQGPKGMVHGGAIATIFDIVMAVLVSRAVSDALSVTKFLNVNYKRPLPLLSTVILTAQIEKIEGRKIFTSCSMKCVNNEIEYGDATALFVDITKSKL